MRIILLLTLCLLARDLKSLQKADFPDSFKGSQTYGCTVTSQKVSGQSPFYHVRVWVRFAETKWTHIYAIRAPEDQPKTLDDCHKWLKEAEKRARQEVIH